MFYFSKHFSIAVFVRNPLELSNALEPTVSWANFPATEKANLISLLISSTNVSLKFPNKLFLR